MPSADVAVSVGVDFGTAAGIDFGIAAVAAVAVVDVNVDGRSNPGDVWKVVVVAVAAVTHIYLYH